MSQTVNSLLILQGQSQRCYKYKQGSVLGPLLFIIYMNDISAVSNMFHPIIYADDSTLTSILSAFNISRNINNNNNSDQINSELNKISVWLKLNKLFLYTCKSKCIVFHIPQKANHTPQLEIDKFRN